MIRQIFSIAFVLIFLSASASVTAAQDKQSTSTKGKVTRIAKNIADAETGGSSKKSVSADTNEMDLLRQQLEKQENSLAIIQELLQKQADLIAAQQNKIEALQQKAGHTEAVSNEVKTETAATADKAAVKPESKDNAATAKVAEPLKGVEAGYGKIKFNGLMQGWFTAGGSGVSDTFRIRRTELKFTGEISPKVKWTLMVDPAKALSTNNTYTTINGKQVVSNTGIIQAGRMLQDAFITYTQNAKLGLNAGQFKVPLSLEGLQSSASLDTVERALFITDRARGGAFGDIRDIGVMAFGSLNNQVDYQIGIFNGSGETFNEVDKNDQKAIAGRIVTRPSFIKGLQIGGSGSWSGNVSRADRPRRDRLGAEMLYVRDKFTFKSELMTAVDGDVHLRGYYTHAGFRVSPKIEIVGRFDSFDPHTGIEKDPGNVTERDYIAGVNYLIIENKFKFQVNYMRKTFTNSISPSRNLLMLNLQTSW